MLAAARRGPNSRTMRWLVTAVGTMFALLLVFRVNGWLFGGFMRGQAVNHIVLFKFRQHATPMAVSRATTDMLDLASRCLHPISRKPYINNIRGGKDHSPEGFQHGATHAFIVEFDSVEDRDYYIEEDPVHKAFQASVKPILDMAVVVDFTDGKFI